MKWKEIQKMGKSMGIAAGKMKKVELIRSIQKAEDNIDCYATSRVEYCSEESCLWRYDCMTSNEKR